MVENGYYWAIFDDDEDRIPVLVSVENGLVYQFGTDISFPVDDIEIIEEVSDYGTDWQHKRELNTPFFNFL